MAETRSKRNIKAPKKYRDDEQEGKITTTSPEDGLQYRISLSFAHICDSCILVLVLPSQKLSEDALPLLLPNYIPTPSRESIAVYALVTSLYLVVRIWPASVSCSCRGGIDSHIYCSDAKI